MYVTIASSNPVPSPISMTSECMKGLLHSTVPISEGLAALDALGEGWVAVEETDDPGGRLHLGEVLVGEALHRRDEGGAVAGQREGVVIGGTSTRSAVAVHERHRHEPEDGEDEHQEQEGGDIGHA